MATKTKPPSKPAPKPKPQPAPKPKPAGKPPAKKKAAKPKPPERFDTPEALAKFDAMTFQVLGEKQKAMRESRAEYTAAKERAADLKKVYEANRVEYEDALDDRKKYRGQKPPGVQLELPFERKADPATDGTHQDKPAVPAGEFKPDAPHADLWRKFPVDRWIPYGINAGDIKKLAEGKIKGTSKAHPIVTVGDLSDFTQPWANDPSRNYGFADIVGLGEAGATRISDAQIRFFNEWNTKGLAAEFAREKGVPLNANGQADAGAGKGTPGTAGGDGDKPGKPAATKPKPKAKRRPIKHTPTTTPKINPRGDDPASPFGDGKDEHPTTVPFAKPEEGEREPVGETATA